MGVIVDSKESHISGPLSMLADSVLKGEWVLVNLRNNSKLLGRVKMYDQHFNMVMSDITEITYLKGKKRGKKKREGKVVERKYKNIFLRGDNVILVGKVEKEK
ncbi:putative small nuclear ribonucleoprotein Sm [Hamiltosporidium magnivora]|uniref:Small nuclear ribonucleoprotein Sm D2 n=2 Tax=Hamiltosporidium TaxID=1176354 RepID=A0A4Q9LDN5_9MICR|nr:putative small nuclear ribonucleoprotein Sm [Hamiltosporidium magnivora]